MDTRAACNAMQSNVILHTIPYHTHLYYKYIIIIIIKCVEVDDNDDDDDHYDDE
jgi:hypothetical protein